MELLSPAGSFSALRAAVENGADAVYFGGNLFNARLGAQNFDSGEMKDALSFCHTHGVHAYITMNTLTHDRDLHSALDYAAFLYENSADALIIQDLGLFSLIKKYIPEFELHASTQMGISTLDGVKKCEELGFKRVVLSRELSLGDISHISRNSKMPLEVFVHGAMCMSFSGGCLFSSMVGQRSGNCGSCAQPCRKYAAIDRAPSEHDLALSLGDLCMLEHLDELERAGAMSLKIEGRMKKPEYIASVTHAYRRALDGADKNELKALRAELREVFSRGEFTTGYYFGDGARVNRIASASPSQNTLSVIRSRQSLKMRPISMHFSAIAGETAKLNVVSDFASITVTGDIVQAPRKPITADTVNRYKEQLSKLGGTAFYAKDINTHITGFIPVSAVNEMRRNAVKELEMHLTQKRKRPEIPQDISPMPHGVDSKARPHVTTRVMNMQQAQAAYDSGADEIVAEYGMFSREDISRLNEYRKSCKLTLALPITLIGAEQEERLMRSMDPSDFDGIEINNLGQIEYAKRFGFICGGMHLNVFNAHTAQCFLDMGLERLTLSPELNAAQVREIMRSVPHEKLSLHIYGRVVLMNLYHCPIKETSGCTECGKSPHQLYDADGRSFPVFGTRTSGSCSVVRLYNCFAHDLMPKLEQVEGINYVLSFTDESPETVKNRIFASTNGVKEALANTTRGYFKK